MVFTFDLLHKAWRKTVTQNSTEYNKARYKYYLVYNLITLLNDLENNTFEPRPLQTKTVDIPKKREVQVPAIRDKVLQHAICDEYLKYKLTKPLIKETSACLDERGTLYASDILTRHLFNYYTHHGKSFYCLKCDIRHYFASIPHDKLYAVIDRYVDDKQVVELMHKSIDQLPVGLALGLQQSQLLANLYLSSLDHFCKEELRAKYYGRYMDDFYIISSDLEYLQDCLERINNYVTQKLGLELNPKTVILHNKIDYLGFTYYLNDTGKVIQVLLPQKRRSKRRHIKKMLRQVREGSMSVEKFVEKYGGWRAHAMQGNCRRLLREWDAWVIDELDQLNYDLVFKKTRWTLKCREH